jgi:hypothetical protein
MASLIDSFKKQMKAAKKEYRQKRHELERALAKLDREYGAIFGMPGDGAAKVTPRRRSGRKYGAVRATVLGAIKSAKGFKPTEIVKKTGLASAQVHNSLTGLKKSREVKVKDGLYTVA